MATREDKVRTMVEEELQKNPNVSNEELFEKAKKIDKGVAELSSRQFNARYPLQVKRRKARAGASRPRRGRRPAAATGSRRRGARQADRSEIREVLFDLVSDATRGEKIELGKVRKTVDQYVERVVKASGGK